MQKLTLTALSTVICTLSIAAHVVAQEATTVAPPAGKTAPATTSAPATSAPAATTAPAGTNAPSQPIEQLKLTKDQQTKLAKLEQTAKQKMIAVLTTKQKEQVRQDMQQGKASNLTLTTEQQTQLKAIQTAALAQRDTILTPEQKQKLQQIRKQYTPQQSQQPQQR